MTTSTPEAASAAGIGGSVPGEEPSYACKSKKRYVVLFGYCGIGYYGLQIQPEVVTIESTLEQAICKTGVVKPENMGDLKRSGWSRAARTDKSVHAVGQVISLRMGVTPTDTEIENFRTALNEALPDDIRVFGVQRTVKAFNSKSACSGRKYEYLIPTFMLTAPDEVLAEASKLSKSTADAESNDDADAAEGSGKAARDDPETLRQQSAFVRQKSPAFDAACRKRFEEILACYVGTKSYHNFTPRMAGDDPRSQRYIKEISLDGPFQINGLDVVRVNIEGQSFMLNQIRIMVAAAIEVMRRGLDGPSVLDDLMDRSKMYSIVLAPGEGLALRACLYEYYNKKFGTDYEPGKATQQNMYESISFETGSVGKEAETFRDEQIYPVIAAQELDNGVFVKWLLDSRKRPFPPPLITSQRSYDDYKDKIKDDKRKFEEKRKAENKREADTPIEALRKEVMSFVRAMLPRK